MEARNGVPLEGDTNLTVYRFSTATALFCFTHTRRLVASIPLTAGKMEIFWFNDKNKFLIHLVRSAISYFLYKAPQVLPFTLPRSSAGTRVAVIPHTQYSTNLGHRKIYTRVPASVPTSLARTSKAPSSISGCSRGSSYPDSSARATGVSLSSVVINEERFTTSKV